MLHFDKIDLKEEIVPVKSNNSKEWIVFHYRYFNHAFKFKNSVCNSCHVLTMLCLNLSNIAIITVKGIHYCCIIHDISKSEAIRLLQKNYVLDDLGYI